MSAILEEDEFSFSVKPDQDLQSFLQDSVFLSPIRPVYNEVVLSPTLELFPPVPTPSKDAYLHNTSLAIDLSEGSKMHISKSVINMIHTRVYHDLRTSFKREVQDYFTRQLDSQLEDIVDVKLDRLLNNTSTNNVSTQNATKSSDLEKRMLDVESLLSEKLSKNEARIESLELDIMECRLDAENLAREHKEFVQQSDENLATVIQKELEVLCPYQEEINARIRWLEDQNDRLWSFTDSLEQYSRREILEFLGIPLQRHEDTTKIIIDFVRRHFGITIRRCDISVSHRQNIPRHKRQQGRHYVAPIYCKFLNRSLVHDILRKRYLLKGTRYEVRENLTLYRRNIKDKAEAKLKRTHPFQWVRNGNIFVKETASARPTKINDEFVLDELIEKIRNCAVKTSEAKVPKDKPNLPLQSHQRSLNSSCPNQDPQVPASSSFPPLPANQEQYGSPVRKEQLQQNRASYSTATASTSTPNDDMRRKPRIGQHLQRIDAHRTNALFASINSCHPVAIDSVYKFKSVKFVNKSATF